MAWPEKTVRIVQNKKESVGPPMSASKYLFIHPWFNANEEWAGLRVNGSKHNTLSGDQIVQLFAKPLFEAIDRQLTRFIPIDIEQAVQLEDRQAVLLVRPLADAGKLDAFRESQRDAGRRVGLIVQPGQPLPASGIWDYVVLEVSHARTLPPYALLGLSSRTQVAVTGVFSRNDYHWAATNQCSLISGEYLFSRASPQSKPDMARVRLLKLLSLVIEDAETREIEEIFRQESKLSYSLLRLVNSAAMAPREPITSFSQAINILGRRQLQRWLQLLVYADPNNGQQPNPLLSQAAARGRLMELLIAKTNNAPASATLPDIAFMTGSFSLLEVLLNLPMPEILAQLPLPELIRGALAEHAGTLGKLLGAVSASDQHDLLRAEALLGELGITPDDFVDAQLEALNWASQILRAAA